MKFVRNLKLYTALAALLIAIVLAGISAIVHGNWTELRKLREYQAKEAQFLMSLPTFESERQRLTLYTRDIIKTKWDSISYTEAKGGTYDKAYDIANTVVSEAMKYPYNPPHEQSLFMLSILAQESAFLDTLKSGEGARGMSQFMGSTARTILKIMGVEYHEGLFLDYKVTIRMQAVLLDILHAEYNGQKDLILADYNGGPWSASYYRAKNFEKLNPETRKYVPEILNRYQRYLGDYKTYKVVLNHVEKGE